MRLSFSPVVGGMGDSEEFRGVADIGVVSAAMGNAAVKTQFERIVDGAAPVRMAKVPARNIRERLRLFASLSPDSGSKSIQALRAGLGEQSGARLDALPFKSQNRYSAVRVRAARREMSLVLGACEALRGCLLHPGATDWEGRWKELLPTGLRILMFARSERRVGSFARSGAGTARQ